MGIEDLSGGGIDYFTTHGFRTLNCGCFQHCPLGNRPDQNQFVVAKKGNGFSIAKNLPYLYYPCTISKPCQLIVESPSESASVAGYAKAVRLPYAVGRINEYPQGATIVCIGEDNDEEAATFGYAHVVLLPFDCDSIYIEDLGMLDTQYAAMLEDVPRF